MLADRTSYFILHYPSKQHTTQGEGSEAKQSHNHQLTGFLHGLFRKRVEWQGGNLKTLKSQSASGRVSLPLLPTLPLSSLLHSEIIGGSVAGLAPDPGSAQH